MIYGQDDPVLFPVRDLYDTGMIQMYVNAVKDEYNRNIEEQKDFVSKYGDFISPFSKDILAYNDATIGKIQSAMDDLSRLGIDPIRSKEGLAYMQKVKRTIQYGQLAQIKQSAKVGQQYLDAMAKMKADGTYNEAFQKFLLGDKDFGSWDTSKRGVWDVSSPSVFKSLNEQWSPAFKDLGEESWSEMIDGHKQWFTGIQRDKLEPIINANMPGFLLTDLGRYYMDQATKQAFLKNPSLKGKALEDAAKTAIAESLISSRRSKSAPKLDTIDEINTKFGQEVTLEKMRLSFQRSERRAAERAQRHHSGGGGHRSGGKSLYGNSYYTALQREAMDRISGSNSNVISWKSGGKTYTARAYHAVKDKNGNPMIRSYHRPGDRVWSGTHGRWYYVTQKRELKPVPKEWKGYDKPDYFRSSGVDMTPRSYGPVELVNRNTYRSGESAELFAISIGKSIGSVDYKYVSKQGNKEAAKTAKKPVIILNSNDKKNLYSPESIGSYSTHYTGSKRIATNRSKGAIANAHGMIPTGNYVYMPMQDGTYGYYNEVDLYNADGKFIGKSYFNRFTTDNNGSFVKDRARIVAYDKAINSWLGYGAEGSNPGSIGNSDQYYMP